MDLPPMALCGSSSTPHSPKQVRADRSLCYRLGSFPPNELVALKGARDVVRISADEDSYSVALAPVPTTAASAGLNSLSVEGGNLWLGGMGVVLRGTGVFDGGAYEVSTVSLTGAPLGRPIYQVRGTSNTNLWAIGVRYALHKTTP